MSKTKKQLERETAERHGFASVVGMYEFLLSVYSKSRGAEISVIEHDGSAKTYEPSQSALDMTPPDDGDGEA